MLTNPPDRPDGSATKRAFRGTWDAIVIGSGIGGLTCGALLSRYGMRVLVLEKHTAIGGYAHTFRRGRYTFESGIHSVPLANQSLIRHILRVLNVEDRIEPYELPSTYHFTTPDFAWRFPSKGEDALRVLLEDFPGNKSDIIRFVDNLTLFYERLGRPLLRFEEEYTDEDTEFVSQFHNRSIGQHIRSFISDERLRQIFYAMWPYAGMNPDRAPTVFYAVMLAIHLVEGSFGIRGGFSKLAQALAHAITRHGGEIRTRSEVTEVLVNHGHVRGVRVASGEEFEARVVISNVSPYLLHRQLLPANTRKALWLKRLDNLRPSVSCVAAYCGLRASPRALLPDTVTFWFRTLDPGVPPTRGLHRTADELEHLILLTTDESEHPATLTLMNFCRKKHSDDWKRDKMLVAEAMIAKAEALYPGLTDLIEIREVGSPSTFERFTGNTDGALYGFENDFDMYAEAKLPSATYIKGLYQTGHWGKPGGGVWNVMHNAYRTAKLIERDMGSTPKPRRATLGLGRRPLRLRFIYPRFYKFLTGHDVLRPLVEKHLIGDYTMPPSLALPILASLTPPDVDVLLTDDNRGEPIDYDDRVDAVVISCFTPQASRAYAIADEFRRRGVKVLLGGLHPTCCPDEALNHADAVCVGEGEPVWPQILSDLRAGCLRRRYQADTPYDLADLPIPRRDIFSRNIYQWNAHLVLVSRGCPVRCAACPIPVKEGTELRFRPYERVLEDILSMPYREFYITDDTVMLPGRKSTKYILGLMERTAGLGVNIFLASTMMMVRDPDFYRKLARGGASSMYTVFGFDRVSRRLFSPECTREEWQACVDLVRMNEDAGIHFFASFGIGFDDQPPDIVERILKFAHEARIDLAEFYITTPFPGTPFGIQAEREGRILHRNYDLWNTGNVVSRPRNHSPEQLLESYYELWKRFYEHKDPAATLRSFRDITPNLPNAGSTPPGLVVKRPRKITFVYPRFDKFLETYPQLAEFPAIAATWAYRMPPALGIPILVKLLPEGWEWRVQDQNVQPIDFDDDADIVAISFFTPQAGYAYEIGDEFLRRGKTVLMGGMHPSMIPEDCIPHCSAVCVGEAEMIFGRILDDFAKGRLQKVYRSEPPPPERIVAPATDVFDIESNYDWHASLVSITRGCPFRCEWCNIPHYQGQSIRLRPMDDVVAEIRALAGKEFYITDDMVMLNRPRIQRYMMELCERIRDFNVSIFLSCSPAMNADPAFLDCLAKAGAKSMYVVFASDPMSTRFFQRHDGVWRRTLDIANMLSDRGIRFFGSFGIGYDCAGPDQFDLILEFCHRAQVKTAEFFIATPFPNTDFWKRIEAENRFILPRDWKKYNCAHVVFKPKHVSEQQLYDGFVHLWTEFVRTVDQSEALAVFHQRAENVLKSRMYSQRVKEAVARGLARHQNS